MRVLITGARAPVALEWATMCMHHGHDVILTDSLKKPLGSFLRGIESYIPTASPRFAFPTYQQQILKIITQMRIDMVIPTCEEVYYLAHVAKQCPEVDFFLPNVGLLNALHNKLTVFEQLQSLPEITLPKTRLVADKSEIEINKRTVLKPVYSRFGGQVIRDVTTESISAATISPLYPWVQQQKIHGTPVCNYAIFEHGDLKAHQAYVPKYCVNGSAASAFQPISCKRLDRFIAAFGKRHTYHGQVSFDFIKSQDELYVIECNPRATSGLHLLSSRCNQLLPNMEFTSPSKQRLHHLGPITLIAEGGLSLFKARTWQDWWSGVNVMQQHNLPVGSQIQSVFELLRLARQNKTKWSDASTVDIEWNGEALNS
ncbi:ATP-grasp domain-containing protein [Vibrio alginolyticus]